MARHWEDREKLKASLGGQGQWGHICWYLGAVFAMLGVAGDAINVTLGLEPTSWLLLAVIFFLAAITFFIGWAVSWYLSTK